MPTKLYILSAAFLFQECLLNDITEDIAQKSKKCRAKKEKCVQKSEHQLTLNIILIYCEIQMSIFTRPRYRTAVTDTAHAHRPWLVGRP